MPKKKESEANTMEFQWMDGAPILIVDNFLPEKDSQAVLDECVYLAPFYEPAKVMDGDKGVLNNKMRKNDVVYLEELYGKGTGDRHKSFIIKKLEEVTYQDKILKKEMGDTLLSVIYRTTHSEMILSRYGKCDFYGWHTDAIGTNIAGRVITAVYYANTIPEQFTGGSIMFKFGKRIEKVVPKHNRIVFFPSHFLHSVENVKVKSKNPADWRFSVNFWSGFKA